MTHIKKLVDNVLTKKLTGSQEKILNKTDLPITWTLAIFKKFSSRYLHKWDSCIDGRVEEVANEWCKQLSGLTGKDIERGLDNWNEDWPPSSVEFKKACMKTSRAAPYHRIVEPSRLIESDGEKAHRKEVGLREIAKIKAAMT